MILLILLLALLLRLVNLNQSLWWDEGITAKVAQGNFWQILSEFAKSDFHPPLHYVLLHIWGNIFGFGEISLRLPSVFFAVATIFLTYLIGKNLFSKKVGIIAAILLTLSPIDVYYSQEARMYALASFTVALSWYFLLRLIRGQKLAGVGYTISSALIFYSDYMAFFAFFSQIIFVLIFYKEKVRTLFKLIFFILLFMLPWIPTLGEQIVFGMNSTNSLPAWKAAIGGANLKMALLLPAKIFLGRLSFDNKIIYGLIVGVVGLINLIVIRFALKNINKKVLLLLFWILIPPSLAFIISFWVPIFVYFRFIFILPAFYLLLAVGLTQFRAYIFRIFLIIVLIFDITFILIYFLNPRFQREDWRDAVNSVNTTTDQRTVILHKNIMIPSVFNYYSGLNIKTSPAFKNIPVKSMDDLNNLENNLRNYNGIILFDYLVEITDPSRILEKEISRLGFKLTKEYDFRGVGFVREYHKK